MPRVITYGTFDTLHYGHILLLQRARALGDHLTVGLSTDAFNQLKGKAAHFDYDRRYSLLSTLKIVDAIIPEENWTQKRNDIIALGISDFAMGDDWRGKFDDLSDLCRVHYFPRTPFVSSTMIKDNIDS